MYENKGADLIKERVDSSDAKAPLAAVLSTIKAVNKTDVATLASQFGVHHLLSSSSFFSQFNLRLGLGCAQSFHRMAHASMEELAMCPGLGQKKVHHSPFFFDFTQIQSTVACMSVGEAHIQCVPSTVHHIPSGRRAPSQSIRRRTSITDQTSASICQRKRCLCTSGRE